MEIDAIANAKRQILEGSLVIWRTRLETLSNAGDVRGALEVLRRPAESEAAPNGNCVCNFSSGCGVRPTGEVILGDPTITPVP